MEQLRSGEVPGWLRVSASVGWRALVLVALAALAVVAIMRLRVIVLPLVVALLAASVLAPPAAWLMNRRWPPLAATWLVLIVAGGLLSGLALVLIPVFGDRLSEVGSALASAYGDIRNWLTAGPAGLDPETVDQAEALVVERAQTILEQDLASQATLIVEVITASVLTLVVTFFYIKDGDRFRRSVIRRFPDDVRPRVEHAIGVGASTLRSYLLGVVVVGLADAILIGIGLALIGVPLVIPIMVLTFFAAFFPMVGAILAGGVATLLALATQGPGDAMLVAGLTIAVQQFDGDVISPLVYSHMVDLHPLSILLALTAGGVLAGLIGAFLAVPILAVVTAVRETWTGENNGVAEHAE